MSEDSNCEPSYVFLYYNKPHNTRLARVETKTNLQQNRLYATHAARSKYLTTYSDGYLGSRNDEERSEMRYVMRIADSVNHQNFERKLRLRVLLVACLFQCP